jgi:hypothetical protein
MATLRIEADRRNALESTGPRTPHVAVGGIRPIWLWFEIAGRLRLTASRLALFVQKHMATPQGIGADRRKALDSTRPRTPQVAVGGIRPIWLWFEIARRLRPTASRLALFAQKHMATPQGIEADRRNASKSAGPRTPRVAVGEYGQFGFGLKSPEDSGRLPPNLASLVQKQIATLREANRRKALELTRQRPRPVEQALSPVQSTRPPQFRPCCVSPSRSRPPRRRAPKHHFIARPETLTTLRASFYGRIYVQLRADTVAVATLLRCSSMNHYYD